MAESDLKTWFLGPRGESADLLRNLMGTVIERAGKWRREGAAKSKNQVSNDKALEEQLQKLLDYLEPRTVRAFSSRYQAHMGWDLLVPGIVGQMVGLLFPSNNVAYEGSPGTTVLEMLVANDLCRMLGYEQADNIRPWGHLVAGGTIGNIEALWAARNLKFLPLALKATIENLNATLDELQLKPLKKAELEPLEAFGAALSKKDLLNLPIDESLALPGDARALLPEGRRDDFDVALNHNSVNQKGIHHFLKGRNHPPKILLSNDNHYSLEKAPALLGLGQDSLDFIEVDQFGRMNIGTLKERLDHWADVGAPVLAVVANLGSTEVGAVDDLESILKLRAGLRPRLDFMVHVDAAFGGYHASLLRGNFPLELPFRGDAAVADQAEPLSAPTTPAEDDVPGIGLSKYVTKQYVALPHADSIAVDPHKLGFLPYPGGAICYRNSALRDLTKFSAPYLGAVVPQGIGQVGERTDQVVGVFGVEGSRAGGAAVAVFLAHSLLRPSEKGYGKLCGQQLYASKKVFSALLSLNSPDLKVAAAGQYPTAEEESVLNEIAVAEDDALIIKGKGVRSTLEECGPDLNLLCYLFNFRVGDGWNQDLLWLNVFNMLVYSELDLQPEKEVKRDLIVARTVFSGREGTDFIRGILERSGVTVPPIAQGKPDPLAQANLFALRSSEWNPWLTEDDPTLKTFRGALHAATGKARESIMEKRKNANPVVAMLRGSGQSDLAIASVIAAAPAGAPGKGMGEEQIQRGVVEVQSALELKGLSKKALEHFNKPPQ